MTNKELGDLGLLIKYVGQNVSFIAKMRKNSICKIGDVKVLLPVEQQRKLHRRYDIIPDVHVWNRGEVDRIKEVKRGTKTEKVKQRYVYVSVWSKNPRKTEKAEPLLQIPIRKSHLGA